MPFEDAKSGAIWMITIFFFNSQNWVSSSKTEKHVSIAKRKRIFFWKKISYSNIIQKCLIRWRMVKNLRQMPVFGSSGGSAAVSSVSCVDIFISKNLQRKNYIVIIKLSLIWPENDKISSVNCAWYVVFFPSPLYLMYQILFFIFNLLVSTKVLDNRMSPKQSYILIKSTICIGLLYG